VSTLNEFFTTTATWARGCGGFVDKFIGDALLVVFGLFGADRAPAEGAAAALRCAIGIEERLAGLNVVRARAGKPPLAVTMGVHSGEVLAGTIGAADRHEYTVIGDTVNVAARLQQACKERGCELLVSETTCELARSVGFEAEVLAGEPLMLRGRREAVRIRGRAASPGSRASSG
jgi:adenylate cyclase